MLGSHSPRQSLPPDEDYLVLLLRGDLFRRYPNSIIYAVKAVRNNDLSSEFTRKLATPEEGPNKLSPLFRGSLNPDVTFFGFALTEKEARGSNSDEDLGWYFVIQEQPAEPKFGIDAENTNGPFRAAVRDWNDLSWNSIVTDRDALDNLICIDIMTNSPLTSLPTGSVQWGVNSSNMAYILLQRPVRIAIHASDMLPIAQNGGE